VELHLWVLEIFQFLEFENLLVLMSNQPVVDFDTSIFLKVDGCGYNSENDSEQG